MCRSRRELFNEYLLAKIGVDTAENEPLEVWGKYSILFTGVLNDQAKSAKFAKSLNLLAKIDVDTAENEPDVDV